jgi:hypothetical protein
MWEGTRALADTFARAISDASPSTTDVSHCLPKFDKNYALRASGFDVVDDGFRALWQPDDDALKAAYEFGAAFAAKIR